MPNFTMRARSRAQFTDQFSSATALLPSRRPTTTITGPVHCEVGRHLR